MYLHSLNHDFVSFSSQIIKWYDLNKRDLPWRHTRNPYFIWLSEIILQQTRVEQGLPYYYKFTETFPDIASIATAKEDAILKIWQGLGYYSRARNLHKAARQVMNEFDGKFPDTYESLKSLSGVGEYTAAAIASFSFNLKHAVVDGNVFRLLSRYFGIETPIDSTSGKKEFTSLAQELLGNYPPATFNQAIMEFGARQCKPVGPDCSVCPLSSTCFAFSKNKISSLPVKQNKTKTKQRYFHYLVIKQKNSFFIKKRNEKDIWQGLHDFPLIETEKKLSEKELLDSDSWKIIFKNKKVVLSQISREFKHILSHQHIYAKFYEVKDDQKFFSEPSVGWKKVTKQSFKKYAVPRLIEEYFMKNLL